MNFIRNPQRASHYLILLFFMVIFSVLDYLNLPYPIMIAQEGFLVVFTHIALNGLMAFLSFQLFALNEDFIALVGKEIKGSNASLFATIFGIFTYGCTPCVISFLALFGINFVVISLPWANLPYKLVSVAILVAGLVFAINQQKKTCELK